MVDNRSTGQRLIKGSIVRTSNLFLQLIVSFFMMPFIIHSLGDRMYGFWVLVGTFIGYYGLLDLGLSSAVGRYVSRALGRNNIKEINDIVNTSLFLFIGLGVIALLISFMAAVFSFYFIENPDEVNLFRKVIVILGLGMAVGFPMRVFGGILTSYLRYDLYTYASILRLLVSNVLIFYFLQKGFGILALAMISFSASLLEYATILFFAVKTFPHLEVGSSFFKKDRAMQLFRYSGKSFIAQIANMLRFKLDPFVIAGFLNLNLVTYYSVGARLMEYFVQFIMSAFGVMSPVFSQYEGRNDFDSIRRKFLDVTKISIIVSVFIGASIIYYGKSFIQRWMGPDFESSYYVVLILCVPYITALMQNPSIGLLYGISKHHYFAITNICEGLLNLIISVILVKYYGIYGVAMGTGISMIILKIFVQPIFVCRVINLSLYKYYFKTLLLTTLKILIPLLLYFYIVEDYLKADYMNIIMLGTIQTLLFIPLIFFLVLQKEERQLIIRSVSFTQ